ncbi:MAG: hypothetical protein IJS36_03050, partial [Kiritimatiellae bacterium]|nr:hypothetical protein [Kiritimatiellia bacterium]
AASLLLAGAAFATATTVDSSYVLGVMPVTATGKNQVILSIPWVAEGGATAIAVTNLVKTAGLEADDTLTWYDTTASKYKQWKVTKNGEVGYWTPVTVTDDTGSYVTPAENATLLRGQAVVLMRKSTSNPIYVIGQVGASGSVTTEIEPAASESAPKYTLIAPPVASGAVFDLNTASLFTGTIHANDEITTDVVNGMPVKFVRNADNTGWRYVNDLTGTSAKVPAGRGFWYKRCGTGSLSITWTAPATANN